MKGDMTKPHNMKRIILLSLTITILLVNSLFAQTSSGKCWYIDYVEWNVNTPALHITCGNSHDFNVGDELTLEMWVKAYTFGENRKVMGKIGSDGSSFNNGYVMGFQNLNVYTEIWNPSLQVINYTSAGPIPIDSAFIHMASTYSKHSGMLRDYINGTLVGETQVFPANPIASNDAEFIIGAAPWDVFAYQFYGALDEVRVWNVERTASQIREFIFKELKGDEQGLIAYYNFNTAEDSTVPDLSENGNTGTLQNSDDPCWSWATSYAPVGGEVIYELYEPTAAWSGKLGTEFNYAVTQNGLSIIADIERKQFEKYVLTAHTGANGVSTENEPDGEHEDFKRMNREWYICQSGNVELDIFFNLTEGAASGDVLPTALNNDKYALLYRPTKDQNFEPIAFPNLVYSDNIIFNDHSLQDGYYTIGYSASSFNIGGNKAEEVFLQKVSVYPNPATEYLIIANAQGFSANIVDLQGRSILYFLVDNNSLNVNISNISPGFYMVIFSHKNLRKSFKLIVQ